MVLRKIFLLLLFAGIISALSAQTNSPVFPSHLGQGTLLGISQPLRDFPPATDEELAAMSEKAAAKMLNKKLRNREYPFSATALPKGDDPAWQKTMGSSGSPKAPIVNIDGQTSSSYPPDCNGAAGPNHYMQTINTTYAIYSKTGTLLAGPTNMNLLFGSVAGANCNDGDPLVLYDEQANRWLAVEFSLCGSNDRMLVAVSTSSDPTGTWYQYSFDVADTPDYEKFGIWRDGYYMAANNGGNNDTYVFERDQMIIGGATPKMVGFTNAWLPTSIDGFMCVPPVDNDGAFAPAGSPGLFIAMNDDAIGGGSDQLWIYELAVNWSNTALSTFNRTQQINVTAFDSNFGNTWDNIKQMGTSQELDGIPMVIMNVPQYRNFGSYQTIVCCHTVDVDATDHAGIRWYELRKTTGSWTVRQTGTYAPDAHSRWMGSIMLNANNKIGLGYSISSSSMYPGIRYAGQTSGAYANGTGVLDVPEETIQNGLYYQSTYNRWGDYSLMSVDPADNETFWFTTQYPGTSGSRKTRIASFKIGNAPVAITLAASAVTGNSATLNATVNPNSLATNYYFEWGTTASYGNVTTTLAAGSGSANLPVSAPLSGLTGGIPYHFRIVAVNADGTTQGSDMSFTPGAAIVTTTAVTGISLTGATSGGNVTSDGGTPVTAYGVCWSTTANPVVTGNHTTDGSGIGSFVSTIAGLTSNTTYHVRAYATNASGTYYGDDVAFTTLCGIYTLPFSESFSGTTLPTCWTNFDNQGSGQIWQFGTISGQSPNPALTGNYAYLNSDAYGSGNSQNADLVTPTLDMSTYSAVNLQFKHYFKSYTGSSGAVYYSINNGSTWTLIQSFTTTSATNPVTFSQAIAAVAGQPAVKFKWKYTGTFGYYWGVDDVLITGTGIVTLSVTPSTQNVASPAGTTPFSVTTTGSWSAVSDAAWCTVTPSGTGNGTLTATCTQNTGAAARTATITVTVASLTPVTVTVVQAGTSPTLSVTPSNQNVAAAAGNTTFTVTSNSAWSASSNAAWCTVTPSGVGNGTLTATFTENTALSSRIATITVTVTGIGPVAVTVTQAAGSPSLAVTPANQNVSASAGNTSFTVTSNTAWSVLSNAAWCTVTPSGSGNGTLVANFTANASTSVRTASITVTASGVSPVTVTVTQSGNAPTLSVTPTNQNVGYAAGNTSFAVTSNSPWTVLSDAAWCTPTLSGSGNGTITASFTENTTITTRLASLTVTVAGLSPVVVTVTQSGTTPILSLTPLNINVSSAAGVGTYTVTSNTSWTTTSNNFWCVPTVSGTGSGTITAPYTENTSLDQRISYMTLLAPGANTVFFTLTQAGASPFLSVDPHAQNVAYTQSNTSFSVSSNMPWTALSNADWCTITTSGTGNGSIQATVQENAGALNRMATITVTASGVAPVEVTVTQAGAPAYLSVTPLTRTVTDPAGSVTFSVSSNTNWTCTSEQSWCIPTPSGSGIGLITAVYEQNLTPVIRTANLQVEAAGTSSATIQLIQLPSFVSVPEAPANMLTIYPNPTTGVFVISSPTGELFDMKASIINAKGKTILTRQCKGAESYTFDLSTAASGTYLLNIETQGKNHVMKLVLQ